MSAILIPVVSLLLASPSCEELCDDSPLPRRVRKGFSLELGIGWGGILVAGLDRYGKEKDDRGFEPHMISLGGFLTNDLGLFFRWKSTYHAAANAVGKSAQRFLGTQTANLQWWVHDRGYVGGGVGLAIFGFGFGSHRDDPPWSFGGALTARMGFALGAWAHHLILISYEVVAGFFRSGVAVGQTLNLSYQYY